MAVSTNDQEIIRDYLLGQLNDDEQQQVEERLLLDDDFFEEFEGTKGELVEQYCAGELDKSQREWFEHHYLASKEGRQQYTLALTLDSVKRPRAAPAPVPVRPTFFERIAAFFKQPWALASTASAVAVVIIAAIWLFRPDGPIIVGPTLASTMTTRDGGKPPERITLPAGAGGLRLRLLLPQPAAPGASYHAALDNRIKETPVEVVESDPQSASVVIPASLLPIGEYAVTLSVINSDGTEEKLPGQYQFNIN